MKNEVLMVRGIIVGSDEKRYSIYSKTSGDKFCLGIDGDFLVLAKSYGMTLGTLTTTEFEVDGDVLYAKFEDKQVAITFEDNVEDGLRLLREVENVIHRNKIDQLKTENMAFRRECREAGEAYRELEEEFEKYRNARQARFTGVRWDV